MPPANFIEDFERTEHFDFLHAVIGRSLIVATRFDSMCTSLSIALEIKQGYIETIITDKCFDVLVNKTITKYRTLDTSIKSFKLPNEMSTILHDARKARNEIAHSLTKELEGCIDTNVNEDDFIYEVSRLVKTITDGDIVISSLMSVFNRDPILNESSLNKYSSHVLSWVVEK